MLRIILISSLFITVFAVKQAVVVLKGTGVDGVVTFTENSDGVLVEGTIKGLSKGLHGFHIHEKGNLTGGCASAAGHFNPHKKNHGAPSDSERHVGDLGNIEADENNIATIKIQDNLISLKDDVCNIIGRAVVVHSDPDDLGKGGHEDSLTTGHAGARVACGVIGIASSGTIFHVVNILVFVVSLLSLVI